MPNCNIKSKRAFDIIDRSIKKAIQDIMAEEDQNIFDYINIINKFSKYKRTYIVYS